MLKEIKAITLIEILVVILIIGILAALALPGFGTMKERALDKEAKANLKLIQAAEKIYRMEYGIYYPTDEAADTTGINSYLKLSLPAGGNANWSYSIPDTEGGSNFAAKGTRNNPPSAGWDRTFKIDKSMEEPCCVSGNCPPDMPSCS